MKHTRAPWLYKKDRLEIHADGICIADIRCYHIADEEIEPNARLIAAAPEMLDALYLVLPYVEMCADDNDYKADAIPKIVRRLKAIIAKAEGRT